MNAITPIRKVVGWLYVLVAHDRDAARRRVQDAERRLAEARGRGQ